MAEIPNAFLLFMKDRKLAYEKVGMDFPNGYFDVLKVEQIFNEWKELSIGQKKKYKELAAELKNKNYHPSRRINDGRRNFVDIRGRRTRGYGFDDDNGIRHLSGEGQTSSTRNLCLLRKEIDNVFVGPLANWRNKNIVICSVLDYFGMRRDQAPGWQRVIPAEIGLAAFSLSRGIVDNYCRVIDHGVFSHGINVSVYAAVKEYGLPPLNSVPDFKDVDNLQLCFERFLERYGTVISEGPPKEYGVFACNPDIKIVQRCLNMLDNVKALRIKVRVLSLSYWTVVASNQRNHLLSDEMNDDNEGLRVAVGRRSNIPLTPYFVYPDSEQYHVARFGIFRNESDVDEIILNNDNYRFHPELCCVYHYKRNDGIQHCALNKSNRLAYSILEYLSLSNRVMKILPGYHYPQLNEKEKEKSRRHGWLMDNWVITKYESMMEQTVKGETIHFVMPDDPRLCVESSQQNFRVENV